MTSLNTGLNLTVEVGKLFAFSVVHDYAQRLAVKVYLLAVQPRRLAARYFRKEFYLLLNLAVGGNYTGITGTENVDNITGLNEANGYEAKMYVDYIRIYQRGVSGEQLITPSR